MANEIGVDIGGTFTDLVTIDHRTQEIRVAKVLTTPDDPSNAIETGLLEFRKYDPDHLESSRALVHGTTLVINSILERKGAITGLITTAGFRDVLEIGREKRYDGNDLQIQFPDPIIPRPYRLEVGERIHASGKVLQELDESTVRQAVSQLLEKSVESIAVSLLNSFANPAHELRIREIIREIRPEIPVSLSHEVLNEIKEFERTSTTAINAYAKPVVSKYLARLKERLARRSFSGELLIMQSNGGLNSADHAREYPVQIVESGPAAGVIGAAHYAKLIGEKRVLAFDMGGTTAKMCLVADGRVARAHEFEVDRVHRFKRGSGIPVRIPVVDLLEIGVGGGSIAKVSAKGTLEVGPQSAGANPGPVCYQLGGKEPTVSDADVVLGYLNPDFFLGAQMSLDKKGAERAIEKSLATPLNLSVAEAAWGIHSVVNENMAGAAKVYVAEKGQSPDECVIVAFGGAGPVHACDLARRIGARKVVIPPRAGVASAFGMLIAPMVCDKVQTYKRSLPAIDFADLEQNFRKLEEEAKADLPRSAEGQIVSEWSADMRYVGQGYEISVSISPGMLASEPLDKIRKEYNAVYQSLYNRVYDELEIECVNLRVTVSAPRFTLTRSDEVPETKQVQPSGERMAYCPSARDWKVHKVFRRAQLTAGAEIQGPAIVEEAESTTIIGTGDTFSVHTSGALVVKLVSLDEMRSLDDPNQINPVALEMLWRRLSSSVDELAAALVRTSFSTIVRDIKDYACAIFDAKARLLVQSMDSTPGIAGGLSPMLRHMLERIPREKLRPGDVLIGNDPWQGSGHHNDIYLISPAFVGSELIGFTTCAAHHVDIGGRRSTIESRDNFEEGLRIPVCKIIEAGTPKEEVFAFIAANVRVPNIVIGDIRAQIAANNVGAARLRDLCVERGWKNLQPLADEIIRRSEDICKAEIRKIPNGVYSHNAPIAEVDGQELWMRVKIVVEDETILADFSGSSPQTRFAINCTMPYTASYASFGIQALLSLPVPANAGTFAPIKVTAEAGTILNATFPAPTFGRTSIGNFIPEMVFCALAPAAPDRVLAPSGATPLWGQFIFGKRKDGAQLATLNSANGGLGARAGQDGVSCLTFPANIGNTPVEILELENPVMIRRRELWCDSAGPGRFRGGLGQLLEVEILDGELGPDGALLVAYRGGRFRHAVPGLLGGKESVRGELTVDGVSIATGAGGEKLMAAGGSVLCRIPGGGGHGDPRTRSRELVKRDIEYGYISLKHARRFYGFDAVEKVAS